MAGNQKNRVGPAGVDRRDILRGCALAGAPIIMAPGAEAQQRVPPDAQEPRRQVRSGRGIAEAETEAGRVAGYLSGDITIFKGVPYADATGGSARFLPPRPHPGWSGVRSSLHYGPVCPQDKGRGRWNDEEAFIFQWNDSVEDEDCLRLNVWTPGLDQARRPVMVWLHGGAFAAGSGHDLPAFDGENLARRGDVVVVTLNHRLNLLGFLDLSHLGEPYAASGNVGMLDIVAALRWIRDNIGRFGGDPERVMIFGQSGGGAKVSTLMAMPAARGLFHRAAIMSGSFVRANSPERSRRLTDLLLRELEIGDDVVASLQARPYGDLLKAADRVLGRENPPFPGFLDVRMIPQRLEFAPVMDGTILPTAPFGPGAPAASRDLPVLIGSTRNEFVSGINQPAVQDMTEAELMARAEAFQPGEGETLVSAFRATTPAATPFDVWARIATAPIRKSVIAQAAARAASGGAPAFVYRFDWSTPVLDGRPAAFHCIDIPFVFANADRCASMTGGGPDARRLSGQLADAFIGFARSGDPNHPALPTWRAFDPQDEATLIVDDPVTVVSAPDRAELSVVR